MNAAFNLSFQAVRRARAWLSDRNDQISTIPALPALVTKLDTALAQVTAAVGTQELFRATSLEATAQAGRIRRELWTFHMLPIVKVARSGAADVANLSPAVRMPQSPRNDERMLAAATAMAQAVVPQSSVFIGHGLPTDFVAQLTTQANTLRQVIDVRGSNRAQGAGALQTATTGMRDARNTIDLIDNALKLALRDGTLYHEWLSAKRVVSSARGASAATPVTPVAGTPATTGTPVTAGTTVTPVPATHAATPAAPAAPAATAAPVTATPGVTAA